MWAEQPATTYAELKKEILNEIARYLNKVFNVAAGISSGDNDASGRPDLQTPGEVTEGEDIAVERAQ